MMVVAPSVPWIEEWLARERIAVPGPRDRHLIHSEPGSMRAFAARLQAWIEAVSVTWWAACASLLALYWWLGAGLHWRRRGFIGLFEILVLPAPFLMTAGFVMSLLWARRAAVSGSPSFRRWLRILSYWLLFTGTTAADIWRRADPDALTRPVFRGSCRTDL
jgi:hypothetical protein